MPATHALIAMLVAVGSGYGVIRTGRAITANAIELQDGGGWAALLVLLVVAHLAAVCVAIS